MVRVIVFALIVVGWWMAAPDKFTAAARTASGTGLKAAGTGARVHWNGGRDGRALGRTKRRDRWAKRGGWWRRLLGLEHGAVITGKAAKGAGKLAGAAVRPVPGAIRDGWRKGQDRHRARTAGRPVPVALDPPWWRRPAPVPVETGQDSGTAAEDSPAPDGGTVRAKCSWTTSPFGLSLFGIQKECGQPATAPPFCSRHDAAVIRTDCADCLQPMGTNPNCSECNFLRIARGEVGPYGPPPEPVSGQPEGNGPVFDKDGDPDLDVRCANCGQLPDQTTPIAVVDGRPICLDCRGGLSPRDQWLQAHYPNGTVRPQPLDAFGRPTLVWPGKPPAPVPPPTDPPVGTSLAGATPRTDNPGGTVSPNPFGAELDDLTSVQDFAVKVADMAEESDFAQLVEFCKHASDETRDFGADMAGDVAEFEEIAAKIGDLLSELVDAAQHVRDRSAELIGG